jgi:hypothetical protein
MNFGDAIEALKIGRRVRRKLWDGTGMFLYYVPEGQYPARTAIARAEWGTEGLVPYQPYIAIKTMRGTVVTWTPSQEDMLAEDWDQL